MLWGLTNPKKLDPATQPTDLVETLMGLESNNLTILSAMNDTLYDRLGDLHAQRAQEKKQALWVRTKWTQSQRNGLFGYKASNQMVEVGVDRAFKRSNGKWYGGVMAQFQRSNFKNDHTNAHGQLMNFGLYASYLADSDWYLDLVGRFGQYKPGKQPIDVADQDIPNARHLEPTSSSGSNILNASVELGRRFVLKQQYFVEPQAQLDYAVMGSRHFTLKEDLDDGHTNIWEGKTHPTKSLLGRVGVALGKTWFDSDGRWRGMAYARLNFNQEFLGQRGFEIHNTQAGQDHAIEPEVVLNFKDKKHWLSADVGVTKMLSDHWSLYGTAGMRLKGYVNRSWSVELGTRYNF